MTAPATKWAEIDAAALRDNVRELCAVAGDAALMAMVKANGYGHGAITVARAALAGGASWLGVSSVAEGLELRAAGLASPILNVGWTPPEDVGTAIVHGIDITVFDEPSVAAAREGARAAGRAVRAHWKVDTGMGRLGTPLPAVDAVRSALEASHGAVDVVALFTHFATADAPTTVFTLAQHRRFVALAGAARASFPDALLHCANSAALLRLPQTHHDIVRAGLAMYGYAPEHSAGVVPLRPALQLRALVAQVKEVAAGDSVGYGRDWLAPRAARVATIAAGYADGVDRRQGNRGSVIVGGVRCPIVGRVSMDQLSADVSEAPPVRPGDVATVIGRDGEVGIDAAEVAAVIGTIPNEVLCAISGRVPRVAVSAVGAPA